MGEPVEKCLCSKMSLAKGEGFRFAGSDENDLGRGGCSSADGNPNGGERSGTGDDK